MMADTPTEPHYIVCYFGAKYAPMLGVLLQSIADVQPCRKVVLLHYDTPADVLRMACTYPNVIARPVERQGYPAAMAAALKPLILADYLASPTLNGPTLVVDCDMLVRRDSFDLVREDDGILFTTRDGVWPINAGILGSRNPLDPGVARFFHRWPTGSWHSPAIRHSWRSPDPRAIRMAMLTRWLSPRRSATNVRRPSSFRKTAAA